MIGNITPNSKITMPNIISFSKNNVFNKLKMENSDENTQNSSIEARGKYNPKLSVINSIKRINFLHINICFQNTLLATCLLKLVLEL